MKKNKVDALFIEGEIPLLYFTGHHFSAGKLLVTLKESKLYVDGRYAEVASRLENIPSELEEEKRFNKAIESHSRIGFDSNLLSWERVEGLKRKYPKVEWVPLPSLLDPIRAKKSAAEIKKLDLAAKLGSQGYDYVLTLLKEGITEKKVAFLLDRFWKENGAQGFSFEPIIAFGENSACPHYRAGDRKLKKGDTVLIDIGVKIGDYCSDMTRTVYFGTPSPKLKKIYEWVRKAQSEAMARIKPGVTLKEADAMARSVIEKGGYGKEFCHSLGHGIGLEVHEWPYLRKAGVDGDTPLEAGMCVTVEPGIYLPGVGGVRIEDTILITPKGNRSLTDRPTDLLVVK